MLKVSVNQGMNSCRGYERRRGRYTVTPNVPLQVCCIENTFMACFSVFVKKKPNYDCIRELTLFTEERRTGKTKFQTLVCVNSDFDHQ